MKHMKATSIRAGMIVYVPHRSCLNLRVLSTSVSSTGKVVLHLETIATKVDLASGSSMVLPAEALTSPVEYDPNWDVCVLNEDAWMDHPNVGSRALPDSYRQRTQDGETNMAKQVKMDTEGQRSENLMNAVCKAGVNLSLTRADLVEKVRELVAYLGERGQLPEDLPTVEQLVEVYETMSIRDARKRAQS